VTEGTKSRGDEDGRDEYEVSGVSCGMNGGTTFEREHGGRTGPDVATKSASFPYELSHWS
jgi:hypothetical protein